MPLKHKKNAPRRATRPRPFPVAAHCKVSQTLKSLPKVAFHSADCGGEGYLFPPKIRQSEIRRR
jgi:hypothetical protein